MAITFPTDEFTGRGDKDLFYLATDVLGGLDPSPPNLILPNRGAPILPCPIDQLQIVVERNA